MSQGNAARIGTSVLALCLAPVASAQDAQSYADGRGHDILFPLGARSFADDVIDYRVGSPRPTAGAMNPQNGALAPDDAGVSLGCGGSAVFVFVDNALIDIQGLDLFVFEVGLDVEATAVEISIDGVTWLQAGTVEGSTSSLDIGTLAAPEDLFRYVRLTDLQTACHNGNYPGADINAVGAIGSVAAVPPGEDWGYFELEEAVIDEIASFNDSCLIEISDPAPPPAPVPVPVPLFSGDDLVSTGLQFEALQQRYAAGDRMRRRAVIAEARDLAGRLATAIRSRIDASEDEDPELTSRVQQLFEAVSGFVTEKTPAVAPPAGPSAYADAFFPSFPSGSSASELVAQWKRQVEDLARHEARLSDLRGWQAVSAWQRDKNELLLRLMLAEEELVWGAVTTPYTEAEIRMLQQPFAKLAAAKERFAELAALDSELEPLYALLEQYSTGLTMAEQALKEADQRYAGLLAAASERCVRAIDALEGKGDDAKQEIVELMKGVSEGFVSVIQSRRKRGIEVIRAAQQSGQAPGPAFRMHRPATGTGGVGEALERRVAQMMGSNPAVSLGPEFAQAVIETSDEWSLPLDSAELDRLID